MDGRRPPLYVDARVAQYYSRLLVTTLVMEFRQGELFGIQTVISNKLVRVKEPLGCGKDNQAYWRG